MWWEDGRNSVSHSSLHTLSCATTEWESRWSGESAMFSPHDRSSRAQEREWCRWVVALVTARSERVVGVRSGSSWDKWQRNTSRALHTERCYHPLHSCRPWSGVSREIGQSILAVRYFSILSHMFSIAHLYIRCGWCWTHLWFHLLLFPLNYKVILAGLIIGFFCL